MKLLRQYLKAVKMYLPREQRNDIINELSENLLSQMEEIETGLGRPRLLFLDEPTARLDVQARGIMWDLLRWLVKDGTSIVLTTHYLEEAEALADRIAVLNKGRLVALGSVNDVRSLVAHKQIRCSTTISAERIKGWLGVQNVSRVRQHLHITAVDAEALVRRLLQEDAYLQELEVSRAGLAEAFTEITQETAP